MRFSGIHFVLGWLIGAALSALFLWLSQQQSGCTGHVFLALLMPLLLGVGGLGLAAFFYVRQQAAQSTLALGLVVASLWPALSLGVQQLGELRGKGCGGGYFVLMTPEGQQQSGELNLNKGDSITLKGRIGGYQTEQAPNEFVLHTTVPKDVGIQMQAFPQKVRIGQPFELNIQVAQNTPANAYTLQILGEHGAQGAKQKLEAKQKIELLISRD